MQVMIDGRAMPHNKVVTLISATGIIPFAVAVIQCTIDPTLPLGSCGWVQQLVANDFRVNGAWSLDLLSRSCPFMPTQAMHAIQPLDFPRIALRHQMALTALSLFASDFAVYTNPKEQARMLITHVP